MGLMSLDEYSLVLPETIITVRSLNKQQRVKLLKQITNHSWFLEAPEDSECEECYGKAFGTLFPITGDPIYDKNAYDLLFCEDCLIAIETEKGFLNWGENVIQD